ncbi:hypothetical protein GOBAR_DD18181 [Gossypium barbadense]|nr:hypothetical protein GOBAR_DD18181 [Gossypium barbadense]
MKTLKLGLMRLNSSKAIELTELAELSMSLPPMEEVSLASDFKEKGNFILEIFINLVNPITYDVWPTSWSSVVYYLAKCPYIVTTDFSSRVYTQKISIGANVDKQYRLANSKLVGIVGGGHGGPAQSSRRDSPRNAIVIGPKGLDGTRHMLAPMYECNITKEE